MRQRFYKMHSLGNDFVVVDGVTRAFKPDPECIRAWGCRHTGIGFDQLLIIAPPEDPDVDFNYQIYNSDGSQAEQCGNGTRCVTALAHKLGLTRKNRMIWESLAGRFETQVENDLVRTTMTRPVLDLEKIPFRKDHAEATENPHVWAINHESERFEITPISMGNPHAVLFVDNLFDIDVDREGAKLTAHPAFPERTNVEFSQIVDRQFIRLRVYERGVGETQACGTGACATVVAARLLGHVNERVKVSLPGGKLRLRWEGQGAPVHMTGPSTLVYEGELD